MPEEINKDPIDQGGEGEENKEAPEANEDKDGGDEPNVDEKKDGGEKGEDKSDPEESPEDDPDDEKGPVEPVVRKRKTVKDHIIERQQKRIAKMEGKNGDDPEEEEDEDISEEDEKMVSKIVERQISPLLEKQIEAEDEQELQQFIADNPEFKEFEAQARVNMKHPSRRELPIESIFYEVAGPKLLQIGARKRKEADEEALKSGTGGGTPRGGDDAPKDYSNMSNADFNKELLDIKTRQ